jgi:CheY-like chemotaxis protein
VDIWRDPQFDKSILGTAQAYGPYEFWTQNLQPGMNPEATWRALLVVAALKDRQFAPNVRNLLGNDNSRVRAWACFALAHLRDEAAVEQLLALRKDPSCRVRFHARKAAQLISGKPVPPGGPMQGDLHWRGGPGGHVLRDLEGMGALILLSDDDPKVWDALVRVYHGKGYRFASAATEQETLGLALKMKPLAIITDNQKGRDNLSGLNMTWDLCRYPELREVVLFMYTADHVEAAFLWNGGDWFVHKADAAKLGSAVAQFLGGEGRRVE